jgi:hypothetical protein
MVKVNPAAVVVHFLRVLVSLSEMLLLFVGCDVCWSIYKPFDVVITTRTSFYG